MTPSVRQRQPRAGSAVGAPLPVLVGDRRVLWGIDVAVVLVSALLVALAAAGQHSPVRVLCAFVFTLLAPGWAAVRFWDISLFTRLVIAMGVSVAICAAGSAVGLWLDLWSPLGILYVLAIATAGTVICRAVVNRGELGQ